MIDTVSYGGGVYISSGNVGIDCVTIEGASAAKGGGIYIENGSLNIVNSTIYGNHAFDSGGAIS